MSANLQRVLVLGGTGSIGELVVSTLGDLGIPTRVLTRNTDRARRSLGGGVDLLEGDLTDPAALSRAVEGVDAVVLTHGAPYGSGAYEAIDYGAVPALLEALNGRNVRVALMSSIGVTGSTGGPEDLLGWKRRGERLLRASGLPYTVIRPGWFDAGSAAEQRAELRQGDATSYGPVRREDVAQALVQAILLPESVGKTVEVFSVDGAPLENWATAFQTADADVPGALDGAADPTALPLDREPEQVRADLERLSRGVR